jgi:hypothetical protein
MWGGVRVRRSGVRSGWSSTRRKGGSGGGENDLEDGREVEGACYIFPIPKFSFSLFYLANRDFVYGPPYVFIFLQYNHCRFTSIVLPRPFREISELARVHV